MVAVAIGVGAVTSIAGSAMSAGAQESAANTAAGEQQREYDQSRADYAPYRQVGQGALYKLADMYGVSRPSGGSGGATGAGMSFGLPGGGSYTIPGSFGGGTGMTAGYDGFQASPGYQWRRDQGLQAIDRGNAARGLGNSGAAIKAEQTFGDGLASSEYENYANRLAALAGIGQSATNSTTAAGIATTNAQSQAAIAAGNARASSYQGIAGGIGQGLNNAYGMGLFGGGGYSIPSSAFSSDYTSANDGLGAIY